MIFDYLTFLTVLQVPAVGAGAFFSVIVPIIVVAAAAAALLLSTVIWPGWMARAAGWFGAQFSEWFPRKKSKPFDLNQMLNETGFAYDPSQDIFYSMQNAWQRQFGYCRLYDEACAPSNLIIDCEPVRFEYDGKKWLIELWKGQYGMTTGGEIGVFNTRSPNLSIPGVFNGTFYHSVSDAEELPLSFRLLKNGTPLFTRQERHWWLTGFVLGVFSEPGELTMEADITLRDAAMRDAFIGGLNRAGYTDEDLTVSGDTVSLTYTRPRTRQPMTRVESIDWVIQRKNELLCNMYEEATAGYPDTPSKIQALADNAPELLEEILNIRRSKKVFESHKILSRYLGEKA